MIWVISDTHFYHDNIIKFENRPKDFNEQIIHNWNSLVGHDDTVIHLGDVIFGMNKAENLAKIMRRLNGKKILCIGNHDNAEPMSYMDAGFDFVVDYFVLNGIAFSHAPLTPLPEGVTKNIHGHFHRGVHRNPDIPDRHYDKDYYKWHEEKYHLIQIEDDLKPVDLEIVREAWKKKKK